MRKTKASSLLIPGTWGILSALLIIGWGCGNPENVSLRKFPHPYQAALAICSDIDETESFDEFLMIQKYLCSAEETPLGLGLDLETGNSFWFYNQYLQMLRSSRSDSILIDSQYPGDPDMGISLFEGTSDTLSPYAGIMLELIRAGCIDCLHSYGEFAEGGFNRDLALRAAGYLKSESVSVDVYINHGGRGNNDNLGPRKNFRGDDPEAVEYHTDITVPQGIKFLWRGQVTHCIGQDGSFSPVDFVKMAYEWFQDLISTEMDYPHDNSLVHVHALDDGQKVFDFVRFIDPFGKHPRARLEDIQHQIPPQVIDQLIRRKGYMILYTHLGTGNSQPYLSPSAVDALQGIKQRYQQGDLFVTTTSRLLNYYVHHKYLYWHQAVRKDSLFIVIDSIANEVEGSFIPQEKHLRGITFYVPADKKVSLLIQDHPIPFAHNPVDSKGRRSVSVRWDKLTFPLYPSDDEL